MKKKIKLFLHRFSWYKILTNKILKSRVMKDPKAEANRAYKVTFKKNIDWEDPKNLIEKIYWLQFNTDTTLWTKCADKYRVRDYVVDCGYGDYLPKLYGKWDNPEDINLSELPNSFVMKSNNGCGTVLIVKNKAEININRLRRKLKKWLRLEFGYRAAQFHYLKIKPCIIAEELLENNIEDLVYSPNSLVDYKVYCINGEPEVIWVAYNRTYNGVYNTIYDTDWVKHPEYLVSSDFYKYNRKDIPKPKCLNQIMEMSRKLSKPFEQVRVDFYVIEDKPIFGELTFTTGTGFFTEEFYEHLGSKIDLNKAKQIT